MYRFVHFKFLMTIEIQIPPVVIKKNKGKIISMQCAYQSQPGLGNDKQPCEIPIINALVADY